MIRALVLIAMVTWITACATLTPAQRGPGEQLHLSKCGACHPRPKAERFDRAGWEGVLDSHVERVPLSAEQRRQLLDHLAAAAAETAPD